jgi:hypothetical protein
MAGHYQATTRQSGGIDIGPAMTFGYIAGRPVAGAQQHEDPVPELQKASDPRELADRVSSSMGDLR